MHEVGIMQSALDAIRQQAVKHGATRVSRIVLRIGTLAGVDLDALRFAYEALAPGGPADGAVLEIESVPARAHCASCHTGFAVGDFSTLVRPANHIPFAAGAACGACHTLTDFAA